MSLLSVIQELDKGTRVHVHVLGAEFEVEFQQLKDYDDGDYPILICRGPYGLFFFDINDITALEVPA